jgi:hypothetical protein
VLYAGWAVPAQAEIANPSSKIAQYQRPARPGEDAPADKTPKRSKGSAPHPKG